MAHFAKLDENNVVVGVEVVSNESVNNLPFPDSEPVGIAFLESLFGPATWKQTSYNNNFRAHYAGIGYTYSAEYDAFIPQSPYSSWVLNTSTFVWEPPVPYPNDGILYVWDDTTCSWAKPT